MLTSHAFRAAPLALLLALSPVPGSAQSLLSPPKAGSENAQTLLTAAGAALEAGNLEEAEALFHEALRLEPGNPMPWLGLSGVHEKRGDLVGALEFARKARKRAPGEAMLALTEGQIAARLGTLDPALAALADARRLDPGNPTAYVLAAILLRDADERKQAITVLEEGIEAKVAGVSVREELCFLLLSVDEHRRVIEVATEGLKIHPDSAPLQLARGLALAASPSTRAQAVESLSTALEGEVPDRGRVQLELGTILLEQGRATDAVIQLRGAAEAMPNMAEVHYRLGAALRASGDEPGARQALERFQALSQGQDESDASRKKLRTQLNEIQRLANQGLYVSALDGVDAALLQHPDEPAAHGLRAKILLAQGREEQALDSARRARELAGHVVDYVYLEGMLLMRSGRFPAAIAQLEKALTLDPSLGAAHGLLALIAMAEDRPEDAVGAFRRAIAAGDDGAEVHERLAQVLASLGRTGESEAELAIARKQRQQQ